MGNWTLVIQGTGAHHNKPEVYGKDEVNGDADRMAKAFVRDLQKAGQNIESATITVAGRENLLTET